MLGHAPRTLIPVDLHGISETLLITLYSRYLESLRHDPIVADPHAIRMVQRLDCDFRKFGDPESTALGVAIRTAIFDREVAAAIKRHPEAVIVSLANGLCARHARLAGNDSVWVNVDLAPVKSLWQNFFEESDQLRYIGESFLDFGWIDYVKGLRDGHVIIIAEGITPYFYEEQVKTALTRICREFSSADVFFDVLNPLAAGATWLHPTVKHSEASFHWGLGRTERAAEWHRRLSFVDEWSIFDEYLDRWGIIQAIRVLPFLRRMCRVCQFSIDGPLHLD